MKSLHIVPMLLTMLVGAFLLAAPGAAQAQATRTWISGVGDDANPCSRTAPCKTFAAAFIKTAAAGEINCLDPGGFGNLNITKAITLKCDGVEGGVLVISSSGLVISAGATDVVYISGLDLQGFAPTYPGLTGIQVISAGAVHITNSVIRGFMNGVSITPSSGAVLVDISNTIIADNTVEGIVAKPTGSGSARVALSQVQVTHNTGDGVFLSGNLTSGNVRLTARESISTHNGADGFTVLSNSGKASILLDACMAFNNTRGLSASGSLATLSFTRSTVTANGTGVNQDSGGAALSYQTNSVDGNGVDGTFGTIGQK